MWISSDLMDRAQTSVIISDIICFQMFFFNYLFSKCVEGFAVFIDEDISCI